MSSGLYARLALVFLTLLMAGWVLTPTFLSKEDQKRIEAAEARAKDDLLPEPETPDPWYIALLPNKKINLGLDLQGGLEMTLDVVTEDAVLSMVQRDILPLKSAAERDGIQIVDARRDRDRPSLKVAPGEGVTLEQMNGLMNGQFRYYTYKTTIEERGQKYLVYDMSETKQAEIASSAVDQALDTIRNRVDATGVKEPSISKKGDRGVNVQLPGETDVEQAVAAIGTTARLEFILVDEEFAEAKRDAGIQAAQAAMSPSDYNDDRRLSQWLRDNGHLPADRQLLWEYKEERGQKPVRQIPMVLKDEVILTGDDINDAQTSMDNQRAQAYVALEFKARGAQVFGEVTSANVGKRFAIVLDGAIRSAPVIQTAILGGRASISMGDGNLDQQFKEAGTLALVLRSGALPAPVIMGETRTVGASLGEQAIRDGVLAAVLGSSLVFLFAVFYYRTSGMVAVVALTINVFCVLALLAAANATLTLPGICGIALTVGMAVDCNILFFERIREELRAGKGVRHAIEAGFDRAFTAVFDANLTHLMAGVVLYSYGTGPIRGFAVTLMIGIVTTLYTGVFVSRTLMDLVNNGRKSVSI